MAVSRLGGLPITLAKGRRGRRDRLAVSRLGGDRRGFGEGCWLRRSEEVLPVGVHAVGGRGIAARLGVAGLTVAGLPVEGRAHAGGLGGRWLLAVDGGTVRRLVTASGWLVAEFAGVVCLIRAVCRLRVVVWVSGAAPVVVAHGFLQSRCVTGPILRAPGVHAIGRAGIMDVVAQVHQFGSAFSAHVALQRVAAFGVVGTIVTAAHLGLGVGIPCPLLALTGVQCPFCGSTRAAGALARGDVAAAWTYNGLLVVGLVVLALCSSAWLVEVAGGPSLRPPRWLRPLTQKRIYLVVGVVAAIFMLVRNLS